MSAFEAFRLPVAVGAEQLETLTAGRLDCRYPAPRPALVEEVVRRLTAARERLAARPVHDIIDAIDRAAARLADRADPLRQQAEALLPAATGYSPAMIALVLDRMAADWRREPLRRLVQAEFGGPAVLDGFSPRGDHDRTRAFGPRLAFHVFAGNVPGVAVTSLIRALLVKAPSLGKLAAGEPVLPVLFVDALASVDTTLAETLAVTYWPGGTPDVEAVALEAADLVIAYGGPTTVASLAGRMPVGGRLVVHGPRFSVAAIGAAALETGVGRVAHRAARTVAMFDQQGCVSPHAIWVEDPDGGRAAEFAAGLAAGLEAIERELPRGFISTAEAALIQQERGAAEMRAHADPRTRVWSADGTAWTVILDPDPAFRPSCLNRFVRVHPIDDLGRLPALLARHGRELQSVALVGAGQRATTLATALATAGATRITTLERLPWPAPHAHHDGAPPLRELVRWVDLEG